MNANMHMDATLGDMLDYSMASMGTMSNPNDPSGHGFMNQLHDLSGMNGVGSGIGNGAGPGALTDAAAFDGNDLAAKNRNRGNYRCSKCGEPKKGHVCPLVPTNFKCNRCGLPKKSCTCVAPASRSIGIQVEMDEDMTTRVLDLSLQGVIEFHKSVVGYPSPPSTLS
uniref:Uncharacterized protein n=1 Tax=Globisporangium ultimum (strain ATCC 200006 / CBS 805.95 / DAOM BR144) TaxID=431595 RepID=K3WPA9_GLOUD